MKKILSILTDIIVFIIAVALIYTVYYLGGGNFERGLKLGIMSGLAIAIGVMAIFSRKI